MRLAIIAFDALHNAEKRATCDGPDSEVRATYARMKADREPVGGLLHVVLLSEDKGRLDSYTAHPKAEKPKASTVKKVLHSVLP